MSKRNGRTASSGSARPSRSPDGRILRHTVAEAAGTGSRLLTSSKVEDKFRQTVAGTISGAAADGIIESIRCLREGGPAGSLLAATAGSLAEGRRLGSAS